MEVTRPWRKILYERQNYPDNHTSADAFLEHLDAAPATPSGAVGLAETVRHASSVALQVTVLALFLAVFKYLEKRVITLMGIAAIDVAVVLIGCAYQHYVGLFSASLSDLAQTCFVFTACLAVCTPVVQSLTALYSARTVNALTVLLAAAHLLLHDYSYLNNSADQLSGYLTSLH